MKRTVLWRCALLPFLALAWSAGSYAQELDDGSTQDLDVPRALEHNELEEVYWVTYWRSTIQPSQNRSMSVITTGNTSQTRSCDIAVDWFAQGGQFEGSTVFTVPPWEARNHCSLSMPFVVCPDEVAPFFFEGFAIVRTQRECRRSLAVDARIYYSKLTVEEPFEEVLATADVKIVRLPRGNRGD